MNIIRCNYNKFTQLMRPIDNDNKKYWSIKFMLPFHGSTLRRAGNEIETIFSSISMLIDSEIYYIELSETFDIQVIVLPNNKESMVNMILQEELIISEIRNQFRQLGTSKINIDYSWYGETI